MDQKELDKLRSQAEQNGIDFDALLDAVQTDAIPDELRQFMETTLGNLAAEDTTE